MEKLTPKKRLKQLDNAGWLTFIAFFESKGLTPRDVTPESTILNLYRNAMSAKWMADDLYKDMFISTMNTEELCKMMGISEQVTPKSNKSKKMVGRFNVRRS